MAKKIRNFAAILAVSAVVGTILLVLVFLLPVGPMRKNVGMSRKIIITGKQIFLRLRPHCKCIIDCSNIIRNNIQE